MVGVVRILKLYIMKEKLSNLFKELKVNKDLRKRKPIQVESVDRDGNYSVTKQVNIGERIIAIVRRYNGDMDCVVARWDADSNAYGVERDDNVMSGRIMVFLYGFPIVKNEEPDNNEAEPAKDSEGE